MIAAARFRIVDAHVIALRDHSGSIVVVNTFPNSTGVVTVSVRADRHDGYGDPAYTFPVRVGTDTRFLTPEQAASMTSDIRRITVLLESIPSPERKNIALVSNDGPSKVDLIEVATLENRVIVQCADKKRMTAFLGKRVSIPIDRIESVWKSDSDWSIAVDGKIAPKEGSKTEVLFRPNR